MEIENLKELYEKLKGFKQSLDRNAEVPHGQKSIQQKAMNSANIYDKDQTKTSSGSSSNDKI